MSVCIPGSCFKIAIVSWETEVSDVVVAVVIDCSCVIVSLGGDDDEEEDVVVVSNETLRCSVDVEEMISSSSPPGEIFFFLCVVVVPVDDLMTWDDCDFLRNVVWPVVLIAVSLVGLVRTFVTVPPRPTSGFWETITGAKNCASRCPSSNHVPGIVIQWNWESDALLETKRKVRKGMMWGTTKE